MKVCCTCKAEKPLTEFNRDGRQPDGRYNACRPCSREYTRRYYAKNREAQVAAKRRWKAENREQHRAGNRNWRVNNLAHCAAYRAQRRAEEHKATPPWADLKSIRQFYKDCPRGWHVDHIDPLKAKDRCGLHTIRNLQYLPADQNFRKNHRTGDEFAMGGYYL